MVMPSVELQILFFFVAGACILGILFLVSLGEKDSQSSVSDGFSQNTAPSLIRAQEPRSTPESEGLWAFIKKVLQFFRYSLKQRRDIFVHAHEMIARFRGQAQYSVLDRTFEQDPEKKFSLQEVGFSPETKAVLRRAAPEVKRFPKLAQKLQDQFEERSEGGGIATENEEEFWLGILRQNPHVAHPYKKLGEIYLKRGDLKEAQASLSFALTKDPSDQEAATLLAEVKEKRSVKK